jgi:hypothetical protein
MGFLTERDARSAPGRILSYHEKNQLSQVFADPLPAGELSMTRDPVPVQAEPGPMPAHNGLRSNDHKCLLPS